VSIAPFPVDVRVPHVAIWLRRALFAAGLLSSGIAATANTTDINSTFFILFFLFDVFFLRHVISSFDVCVSQIFVLVLFSRGSRGSGGYL
jgi:hypothetical protein